MNNESRMIFESYKTVEEGMWNRLAARGSQAIGAVKGLGVQAKGAIQKTAGSALKSVGTKAADMYGGDPAKSSLVKSGKNLTSKGTKNKNAGARMGQESKYRSYLTPAVDSIIKDLKKLNMPFDNEATLKTDLIAAITKHLSQVTPSGQFKTDKGKVGAKVI
jgi:hypothetical protein